MPRALISVWDKTGVVDLAQRLTALGFEILSTGGTARAIDDAGVSVREVSDVTGFPEILEGRVKTLHPAIHGGLLARRDIEAHMDTLKQHGITPIDVLVSNLYPFSEMVADPSMSDEAAIEHIDIGGPAMVRAAAKNHSGVVVLVDPADYDAVLDDVLKQFPQVVVFDPRPLFCQGDRCQATDGELPYYFNGDHVNWHGAEMIIQALRREVRF